MGRCLEMGMGICRCSLELVFVVVIVMMVSFNLIGAPPPFFLAPMET